MTKYAQHVSPRSTPQSESARDDQKQNNAGGFSFVLDAWARLDRWLILGAEGGTYYVGERALTKDNAKTIQECIRLDGARTVQRIVEISDQGRAPKNDPAIFALALAAAADDANTRKLALDAIPKVCRIGTHLFQFVASVNEFRGWGSSLREAVGKWYTEKPVDKLAVQVLKYQQRNGWSHRDVLRLCHVHAPETHQAILRWAVAGHDAVGISRDVRRGKPGEASKVVSYGAIGELPKILAGYEVLKAEKDSKKVARLIEEHGFTHEMIPTEHKNSPEVWEALLQHMPMTAMIRNLGKMTSVGILKPLSAASKKVSSALVDKDALRKARIHPISVLSALRVYQQGHGEKGKLSWTPDRSVVDALDEAFYLAFQAIEPTGKNILLALDVSGSMGGGTIAGVPGLTPRDASAAMAMVTARSEKSSYWHCVGFTSGYGTRGLLGYGGGSDNGLTSLDISPKMRLDDVVQKISGLPFGGTDCALPLVWALKNKIELDAVIVYTDNESWAGPVHVFQAMKDYRQKMGRATKLVAVGMTATEYSVADPNDAGMMDVVGFDTAAPAVMADFVRH